MFGRSSRSTIFLRADANTDVYAHARVKKVAKECGVSATPPFQHLKGQWDLQDAHVEGSSEKAENWVVFVVSLYSTISKSISRASTRRLAVFPEPAGPVRMSRRCNTSHRHLLKSRNVGE